MRSLITIILAIAGIAQATTCVPPKKQENKPANLWRPQRQYQIGPTDPTLDPYSKEECCEYLRRLAKKYEAPPQHEKEDDATAEVEDVGGSAGSEEAKCIHGCFQITTKEFREKLVKSLKERCEV